MNGGWANLPDAKRERGFSLIELLVVMGLVALFMGGISLAGRDDGGRGMGLQAAQAELASLLGATRAQAVIHQTAARLLVCAALPPAGDADKYLRCLQIVRRDPLDDSVWIASGGPVYLPAGTFVVPPVVPLSHLAPGVTWPSGSFAPVSTLLGPANVVVEGSDFGEAYFIEYQPDGRPASGLNQFALANGRPTRDSLPQFDNPAAARGVRLRPAGSVGLINTTDDF